MAFKVSLEAKKALKKTLISVDIQPEYYHTAVKNGGFNDNILHGLISALNSNSYSKKVVLYNGADTLGMISLNDYQMWLLENGLEEDRLNECLFYDKGYAFFRFMMDSGIDEDDIVLLVKFMQANNINDSRQITETGLWDKFMQEYNKLELRELLEDADDCINIPDLMDWLIRHVRGDNIELIGGGQNECLQEVQIALKALGIHYTRNDKLVYEGQQDLFGRIVAAPVSTVKELRESYGIESSKSGFDDVGEASKEDLAKVNAIINNKALPEVAEKGKAYVVIWADGRGRFACKKKSYLSKWLKENGSWAEIISIKYEDPKKLKVISEVTTLKSKIVRYFLDK